MNIQFEKWAENYVKKIIKAAEKEDAEIAKIIRPMLKSAHMAGQKKAFEEFLKQTVPSLGKRP